MTLEEAIEHVETFIEHLEDYSLGHTKSFFVGEDDIEALKLFSKNAKARDI